MSLISRIEISNYLTEGLNASRRIADWRPMISAVTLRMDSKSALLNLTNGGGKTSMADLVLYLLSRDTRLLTRIRDKCSPKDRGFTHARIEFRDTSDDSFVAPGLLEPDPLNVPGRTYVVGVVLYDKADEQPIFYLYSGTLEDSPCYEVKNGVITLVPDAQFVEKTKSVGKCSWNKHPTKSAWEDAISLHISTDVLRRNVKYQCEGSDDKNAQFFSFKPRGGQTYAQAFFRSVVAPDLLTNILSTWAEEGEQSIEDTLYLSLSQIVKTDDEIQKKDNILKKREAQLGSLQPLLELGNKASGAQAAARTALEAIRKDAALAERFGTQTGQGALPGIPKSPDSVACDRNQDPRVMQALRGMFLSPDGTILIFDDAIAKIANTATGNLNLATARKNFRPVAVSSQAIDFMCNSPKFWTGARGGGVTRKGYTRDAALQIPELIKNHDGVHTDGLAMALELAFDIAEAQLDTNPASIRLRGLDHEGRKLKKRVASIRDEGDVLEREGNLLRDQITSRSENRASWEEFQQNTALLPEHLRMAPLDGKRWLEQRQEQLRQENDDNLVRHTLLAEKWKTYTELINQAGLGGVSALRARYGELVATKAVIGGQERELAAKGKTLAQQVQDATNEREATQRRKYSLERDLNEFARLQPGYTRFRSVFGAVLPSEVDPEGDLKKARVERDKLREEVEKVRTDTAEKEAMQSAAARFSDVYGDVDPRTYSPIDEERKWRDFESQAQQSAARLVEKVEAIESFEALFPGEAPDQWIARTDQRREELSIAMRTLEEERARAVRELDAIGRMSVVDDGHYAAAWEALRTAAIPCQRLAEVLMRDGQNATATRAAMSAMSGLLPAPVFDTREAMLRAAEVLANLDIAVPLVAADELIAALTAGTQLGGDVFLAGFIAGPYSRQARILLEPAYAESEIKRLKDVIKDYESQISTHTAESLTVRTDNPNYTLAMHARDGLRENALKLYKSYLESVEQARRHIDTLKLQTSESALAVLKAAKAYLEFGGDFALAQLENHLNFIQAQLRDVVEPKFVDADLKASHDNLSARADAIAYINNGGEDGHLALKEMLAEVENALAEASVLAEELQAARIELEQAQEELDARRIAYEDERGEEQIQRLTLALAMDEDESGKMFMASYERESKTLATAELDVRTALQVNFERAQTFRDNMGVSDADIEDRLTQIAAKLANLKVEADGANARLELIDADERPPLLVAARAIHELAGEAVRLATKMRTAIDSTHSDFPEIAFSVEAHPSYKALEEILHQLRAQVIGHDVIEAVSEMRNVLQMINDDDTSQAYLHARKGMIESLKAFETAKNSYCASAREQSSTEETALNALEIDEIEQSDITRLQALTALFASLQNSVERDKEAALRTKASAEAAHQIAIEALSRLIGNAQVNLTTLEKVMARYPKGRFFVTAEIVPEDRIMEILEDLKDQVARQFHSSTTGVLSRSDEGTIKAGLRNALIDRVFLDPSVEFVNAAIWGGKRDVLTESQSTGQKVALQFMWIVRQAEFEIERRLLDMGSKQAKKERNSTNRLIIIDGIFSSLSNRELIKEAMSGLRDLGGNFQIIGLLHSETWVNDYEVFPVYLVGRKLQHSSGHKLISFADGRPEGTLAMFSSYARKEPPTAQ